MPNCVMRLSTKPISSTSVRCLPRSHIQSRLPKNTWQQNVLGATFLCCLKGLVAVLLALVISTGTTFSYESAATSFPEDASPTTGPSDALSDLDGDGLPDVATVNTGGLQEIIELQLSRVNAPLILPSPTPVSAVGALSMQDVDHDGDTDLLWIDTLPSHKVIVWLNDGAGRFECLCPPDLQAQGVGFARPGVNTPFPRAAKRLTTPERVPILGPVFAANWTLHVPAMPGRLRPAPVWDVFTPPHIFTTRGPPSSLSS